MLDQLNLITKEHSSIMVDPRFANLSGLISTVVEDAGPNEEIPIEYISEKYLNMILEYARHHDFVSPPLIQRPIASNNILELVTDAWDADFVQRVSEDEDQFYEFIMAVNYLDIKCILDLCLAFIAAQFKGKPVEELREKYNIQENFTPEVEENLKSEFSWALDQPEDKIAENAPKAI